jgi:hypothetical protein
LLWLAAPISGPTTPSAAPLPVSFKQNAPPTSGPHVQRGVPLAVGVGPDPETHLVLLAGFGEPLTAANCEHPENIPLSGELTQQQVSTPAGREQFTTPRQEVEVLVTLVEEPPTSFCDLVVGVPIIATGTATATWGEKNVPPPGELGPGAGTLHITFHGVINLATGGQARLFARGKALFRNGEFVSGIDIVRLTPL